VLLIVKRAAPRTVSDAYYPGRSGNLIISEQNKVSIFTFYYGICCLVSFFFFFFFGRFFPSVCLSVSRSLFLFSLIQNTWTSYNNLPSPLLPSFSPPSPLQRMDVAIAFSEAISTSSIARKSLLNPAARSNLNVHDVGNVVAHLMGVPPLSDETSTTVINELSQASMFNHASGNLFVSVFGMQKQQLIDDELPNLAQFFAASTAAGVRHTTAPRSSFVSLVSMLTGQTPSEHGVVGEQWPSQDPMESSNKMIHAYEEPLTYSSAVKASLYDVMAQTTNGRGAIVSVSSSSAVARAMCPHQSLFQGDNQPGVSSRTCLTVSMEKGNVVDAFDHNQAAADVASTLSTDLWNELATNDVTVTLTSNVASVQIGDDTFNFDMKNSAHATVFAELALAFDIVKHVSQEKLVDSEPDLFSVGLSSLSSTELIGDAQIMAMRLVDAALPLIVKNFHRTYPGRSIAEIALLGTSEAVPQQVRNEIVRIGQTHSIDRASLQSSNMYVSIESAEQLEKLCADVNEKIQHHGYEAHCIPTELDETSMAFIELASGNQLQAGAAPSDADVDVYQIVLWLMILLSFALYAGAYSIGAMDYQSDTLLYSKFNPNWTHKR
jgi:Type I phosphodiesterase / nucleotide pyrophosphatase